MEFDEMKKIWDSQSNQTLYSIDKNALHNRILSKKKRAQHITTISEVVGIIAYIGPACFIVARNFSGQNENIFMYLLAGWMFITGTCLLVSRILRRKGDSRFDRSMAGDLSHAISVATYQVRLSRFMRWNVLPIAIFILPGIWHSGKSIWIGAGTLIFFILVNYAAGWEHNIYKSRQRELKILQSKLEIEK
jgi:hypothetical protein